MDEFVAGGRPEGVLEPGIQIGERPQDVLTGKALGDDLGHRFAPLWNRARSGIGSIEDSKLDGLLPPDGGRRGVTGGDPTREEMLSFGSEEIPASVNRTRSIPGLPGTNSQ